jgi:hypothetical protein
MQNMNRRIFIVGTAAALVATQLPMLRGQLSSRFDWRDIRAFYAKGDPKQGDRAVCISLGCANAVGDMLSYTMNQRREFMWRDISAFETGRPGITCGVYAPLRITLTPPIRDFEITLFYNVEKRMTTHKLIMFEETLKVVGDEMVLVRGPTEMKSVSA